MIGLISTLLVLSYPVTHMKCNFRSGDYHFESVFGNWSFSITTDNQMNMSFISSTGDHFECPTQEFSCNDKDVRIETKCVTDIFSRFEIQLNTVRYDADTDSLSMSCHDECITSVAAL